MDQYAAYMGKYIYINKHYGDLYIKDVSLHMYIYLDITIVYDMLSIV
jgi:hypothetical protein